MKVEVSDIHPAEAEQFLQDIIEHLDMREDIIETLNGVLRRHDFPAEIGRDCDGEPQAWRK